MKTEEEIRREERLATLTYVADFIEEKEIYTERSIKNLVKSFRLSVDVSSNSETKEEAIEKLAKKHGIILN